MSFNFKDATEYLDSKLNFQARLTGAVERGKQFMANPVVSKTAKVGENITQATIGFGKSAVEGITAGPGYLADFITRGKVGTELSPDKVAKVRSFQESLEAKNKAQEVGKIFESPGERLIGPSLT